MLRIVMRNAILSLEDVLQDAEGHMVNAEATLVAPPQAIGMYLPSL